MKHLLIALLAISGYAWASGNAHADYPGITLVWESDAVLAKPENVIMDTKRQRLYISNINGEPNQVNGLGFISVMAMDGKIIELEWIKGLNAPKGMEIHDDVLYVADIDALVAIDIEQQRIIARYPALEAKFLNDVVADKNGDVYVSDMMTESIYRLHNDRLDRWLHTPELQAPNGLIMGQDKLIVGGWGVLTEGFGTSVDGHLKTVDLKSKAIKSLGSGQPLANIDGLESDGKGRFLVTDWMKGGLLRVNPDGSSESLLTLKQGNADIYYLSDKRLVLIPMMLDNTIRAYQLPD